MNKVLEMSFSFSSLLIKTSVFYCTWGPTIVDASMAKLFINLEQLSSYDLNDDYRFLEYFWIHNID